MTQNYAAKLWYRFLAFLKEMAELWYITGRSNVEVSLEEQILDAKTEISLALNDKDREKAENRVNVLCTRLVDFAETEDEVIYALMQTQPGSGAELFAQQKLSRLRLAVPE